MMANIPCGDKDTFDIAVKGLLEKHQDDISDYVKKAYLNGNQKQGGISRLEEER